MAVLSGRNLTLLDLANIKDPDGSIATVVEILNEENEILDDMVWKEGNLTDGHQTTIRTGIPEPTWRKLYGGVMPTKSTTAPIKDTCGMLEAYCEVDKKLFMLEGQSDAWRLSEDAAHLEGMNQEIAHTLFFGNESSEPEAFTGLSPRFNRKAGAESGDNVLNAGGTGTELRSIWLVVWGDNTVHGIVPKGSQAGFQMENLGQDTKVNPDGSMYEVLRTHYMWDAGLTVRDWRYVVRIANIPMPQNISTVWNAGEFDTANGQGGPKVNLPNLMFHAMRLVPNLGKGRPAFYMSRDMATAVAQQTVAMGSASFLTSDQVGGSQRFTERFHGIPMRRVDKLVVDQSAIA